MMTCLVGTSPAFLHIHLVIKLTSSHKGWAKISNIQIILYKEMYTREMIPFFSRSFSREVFSVILGNNFLFPNLQQTPSVDFTSKK